MEKKAISLIYKRVWKIDSIKKSINGICVFNDKKEMLKELFKEDFLNGSNMDIG